MRATIGLRIVCRDAKTARSLESVLKPDNEAVPRDQRFSMLRSSADLLLSVQSDRIPSAFTTAISVLTDAALFQEIWLISHRAHARSRGGSGC